MYQKSAVIALIAFVILAFVVIANHDRSVPETAMGEVTTQEEVQDINNGETGETGAGMPAGKIDVRVACESALMYMSFMDGAAAEAFVEECALGKHPEVIERYINDMGMDGAVI